MCRLERWGRSVADLLATLQELEHLGVGFVSLIEALDLTTPAGRAMAGLLAVFAANADERSWVNELALGWPTPGRTANVWAGPQRLPRTRPRSGDYIAPASPKPRSPVGWGSGALRCAESWVIPPGNRSARLLTQAHRKHTVFWRRVRCNRGQESSAVSTKGDVAGYSASHLAARPGVGRHYPGSTAHHLADRHGLGGLPLGGHLKSGQ